MMSVRTKKSTKMSERGRTTDAERQQKCRRGTRSDLTRVLEELLEQRRLLEMLTASQAAEVTQQGEQHS